MKLSKKDIIWGYFAQFFSIASGILVLPLILKLLTPEEIGMNYLMLTVGSMVSLLDFGFAPQFGRNFSYIFGGAQYLKKEGIELTNQNNKEINYRLLTTLIHTAKTVYRILSLIVLFVMLSLGTLYIYSITDRFTNVENSLLIWITYSVSTFFNIYYTYYSSLLIGKGLIMEAKKAMVYSKIAYIIITVSLLLFGAGLIGVVLANFVSPFVSRFLSHHYFYTKELSDKIKYFVISRKEKSKLFKTIWHNAKKLGLVFIGSYAITKFGMFMAGLYLPLTEVASYGIMIQLVNVISTIAGTLFVISNPRFSVLKIEQNHALLLKEFAISLGAYYLIFILGGLCLAFGGSIALSLIKSKTLLPATTIIFIYAFVMMLEGNHSFFATMIVIGNTVPFMWISLITGGVIVLVSFFTLHFTNLGILGLVLAQGIVQVAYNNWKWPLLICREFKISYIEFLMISYRELILKIKNYFNGRSKYRFFQNRG